MDLQAKPNPFRSTPEGLRRRADGLLLGGLLAALAAGIFFRLLFVEDVQFIYDHALALVLGAKWLESPHIATHGMLASVGIANPPATIYFFAAFFGLSGGDPQKAAVCAIVWNLIGLVGAAAWLFGMRGTFGRFWTFWILAFICLNPWAVICSRRVWAQDLLFPLVVGTVAGLSTIGSERWDWRKAVGGLVCLAVASQVHMSAVFWGVGLGVGLLVFWPARHWRRLLPFVCIGAGILALVYLPWVLYLLRERPAMTSGIPSSLGESTGRILWHLAALDLGVGWPELRFMFGQEEATSFFDGMGPAWKTLQVVSSAAVVSILALGLARLGLDAVRRRTSSRLLFAPAISLVLFVPLLRIARVSIHQHYAIVLLWPVALVCGFGWREAERHMHRRRWARTGLIVAATLVLFACAWSAAGFMLHIRRTGGSVSGYQASLRWDRQWLSQWPAGTRLRPDAALEIRYLYDFMKNGHIAPDDYPDKGGDERRDP